MKGSTGVRGMSEMDVWGTVNGRGEDLQELGGQSKFIQGRRKLGESGGGGGGANLSLTFKPEKQGCGKNSRDLQCQ